MRFLESGYGAARKLAIYARYGDGETLFVKKLLKLPDIGYIVLRAHLQIRTDMRATAYRST
jgi:hypothetical protein